MGLWQVGGKIGSVWGVVWESCWVDKMVRTRVHACEGRREGTEVWDDCSYGVSGALGARGREVSGPSGVVEMDGREFGASRRFARLCHSGWCLILHGAGLQVWRGSSGFWIASSDYSLGAGGED